MMIVSRWSNKTSSPCFTHKTTSYELPPLAAKLKHVRLAHSMRAETASFPGPRLTLTQGLACPKDGRSKLNGDFTNPRDEIPYERRVAH